MGTSQLDKDEILAPIDFYPALLCLVPGGDVKKYAYWHLCPFHEDKNIGSGSTLFLEKNTRGL